MNFIQVWLIGYKNPTGFVNALKTKPAPLWGFRAQVLRSLMDSFLLYLPLALLGRVPATPSFLTFIPTEKYYITLIWLTPLIFTTEWLLGAAVIHSFLRLSNLASNIDQILNITGMAGLVVGAVFIVWDWSWFLIGGVNQYFLGISHLVIDIWWFALVVIGLKELLCVPVRQGIVFSLLAFAAGMPFAVIFMRAPF